MFRLLFCIWFITVANVVVQSLQKFQKDEVFENFSDHLNTRAETLEGNKEVLPSNTLSWHTSNFKSDNKKPSFIRVTAFFVVYF